MPQRVPARRRVAPGTQPRSRAADGRTDREPEDERQRRLEHRLERRTRRAAATIATASAGQEPGRVRRAGDVDPRGPSRGQSRTRGGLSRSNMWTVSTKRTCFVW